MSSPLVERLAWTLIHSLWQATTVAALLAIAMSCAYKASARVRYGLGCVALFLLFLLPATTFLCATDPWLGASLPVSSVYRESTRSVSSFVFTASSTITAPSQATGGLAVLVGLWLAGVFLLSLRLVGSLVQIERWRRRHTRSADAALVDLMRSLAGRLGIAYPITVLVADARSVPSAWGLFRPAIAIPLNLISGLSPVQLEAILLHELAHIRRFDFLVNVLQSVVETLLFFHPAAWWISSLVRREREYCCDDLVVAALGDPLPYARALLQLEERRHALPHPALSARGGHLMNRIQRILARPNAPSRLLPTVSAIATLGIVATVLSIAGQVPVKPPVSTKPTAQSAASVPSKLTQRRREIMKTRTALTAERASLSRRSLAQERRLEVTLKRYRKALRESELRRIRARQVETTARILEKRAAIERAKAAKVRAGVRPPDAKRAVTPPAMRAPAGVRATHEIELRWDAQSPSNQSPPKVTWVIRTLAKPGTPEKVTILPAQKRASAKRPPTSNGAPVPSHPPKVRSGAVSPQAKHVARSSI